MAKALIDYYGADPIREWDRLSEPNSRLEYATTMHLIEKHFPAQGRILDIGGGPGRYAIELLRRGFEVTLLDVSQDLINLAKEKIAQAQIGAATFRVGDARDLKDFPDSHYDAALLMGPLYHILDRADRILALREASRVVRQGGVCIASYLNTWGLIGAGVYDFPRRYEDIEFLRSMLGEQHFEAGELSTFTQSYWGNPKVAAKELAEGAGRSSARRVDRDLHPASNPRSKS